MQSSRLALLLLAGCGFEGGARPGATSDATVLGDAEPAMADGATTADAPPGPTSTIWLQHDFEADLIGPFSGIYRANGDSVTLSTTIAHAGVRAANCRTNNQADNQAAFHFELPDPLQTEVYVGFWVRLEEGFPPGDAVMLAAVVNAKAVWTNIATLDVYPDMSLGVTNGANQAQILHSTKKLTPATWHHVELRVRASTTSGRIALAIDGQPQYDETTLDTGSLGFHRVLAGIAWQVDRNDPQLVFIDDVTIAER